MRSRTGRRFRRWPSHARTPNGIVLSPDEQRLYVSETWTRKIVYYELSGPGQIVPNPNTMMDTSYLLTAAIPSQAGLDSIRIDEEGNVYVVSVAPQGFNMSTRGGITVVSPPQTPGGKGRFWSISNSTSGRWTRFHPTSVSARRTVKPRSSRWAVRAE